MRCSYSATFMGVSVKKGFLNILMCWDLQWLREKKAFYSLSSLGEEGLWGQGGDSSMRRLLVICP